MTGDRDPNTRRYFFVHVMKTGGGTFRQHIRSNFSDGEIYPLDRDEADLLDANYSIAHLTGLSRERRERIRIFTGHFPFVAADLLEMELTTITILRDPVERTLSYLRHCKRRHPQHRDLALEEIYEDPFFFPCFIKDHQAKMFALTAEDHPESYMDVLDIDAPRLEIAKANLERVGVLGIQENFEGLLGELRDRFGWRFASVGNRNVGMQDQRRADGAFRRRIAEDNQADIEFYAHARQLCERRRVAGGVA